MVWMNTSLCFLLKHSRVSSSDDEHTPTEISADVPRGPEQEQMCYSKAAE